MAFCDINCIIQFSAFSFRAMKELNLEKIQNNNETKKQIWNEHENMKAHERFARKRRRRRGKKNTHHHTQNGSDGDEKPVAQWMHAKKGKSEDCFVREFVYLLRAKYPPSNTHFGSKWMSAENITSA